MFATQIKHLFFFWNKHTITNNCINIINFNPINTFLEATAIEYREIWRLSKYELGCVEKLFLYSYRLLISLLGLLLNLLVSITALCLATQEILSCTLIWKKISQKLNEISRLWAKWL